MKACLTDSMKSPTFVDGEFLETESIYSIDLSWAAPRESLFRDICTVHLFKECLRVGKESLIVCLLFHACLSNKERDISPKSLTFQQLKQA